MSRQMINKIKKISKQAGNIILNNCKKIQKSKVSIKGEYRNIVTYVDKEVEKFLTKELQKIKKAEVLAEEYRPSTKLKKDKMYWVIDPLDGTVNYYYQISIYAVSIALCEADKPVIGCVYMPKLNEFFYALKGEGAYLNNEKIRVSKEKEIKKSLIATGFPYDRSGKEFLDNYKILKYMIFNCRDLRRMGAAAYDICQVACSRLDAYWETGLKPWDVAAGGLILKEAGGKISDWKGDENNWFNGKKVLITNNVLHNKMLNLFNKLLK